MENQESNNNNQQGGLVIHSQYIKDMSLEIPLAPEIFKEMNNKPDVHVDINMGCRKLEDGNYCASLNVKMDSDIADKKLFIVELTYECVAGINVAEEHLELVQYIELPRLMFPFVRSIIANSLSEAGLPPMMLNPIDFFALYNAKKSQQNQQATK